MYLGRMCFWQWIQIMTQYLFCRLDTYFYLIPTAVLGSYYLMGPYHIFWRNLQPWKSNHKLFGLCIFYYTVSPWKFEKWFHVKSIIHLMYLDGFIGRSINDFFIHVCLCTWKNSRYPLKIGFLGPSILRKLCTSGEEESHEIKEKELKKSSNIEVNLIEQDSNTWYSEIASGKRKLEDQPETVDTFPDIENNSISRAIGTINFVFDTRWQHFTGKMMMMPRWL